jgi:hypothetical protein
VSAAQPDALRIGDAERESAAADLGEHFAQGRLSADEHEERLEQVWAARTRAELAPVFGDLPGGTYGARPEGPTQPRAQRPWRARRFPVPVLAFIAVVVLVTVVTHVPFLVLGLLAFWLLARRPRRHWNRGRCGAHS